MKSPGTTRQTPHLCVFPHLYTNRSGAATEEGNNNWTSYRALRYQLVAEGKLVDGPEPGFLVFAEDVPFSSTSAAAAVVYGGNQQGPVVWRTKGGGRTYRDWQLSRLNQAGVETADS